MKSWGRALLALMGRVAIGTVPIGVFASGEVLIPDMNVLGEDLSLYGLGGVTAADLPGHDKERFLSDNFFKSGFFKAPRYGKSFAGFLDTRSAASAGAKAAFFSRSADAGCGFIASVDTKFSGEDGRRRLLYGADFLYKKKGQWNFQAEPRFFTRNYELPASPGSDISETLAGGPLSLYSQTENSFFSFSAEKLFMNGKYPAGFYVSSRETDFSSNRFSASADSLWKDFSFNAKTSLSRENWDWADGEKSFTFYSADCSVNSKLDKFSVNTGLEFVKWADNDYTSGKFLVSFPAFAGTLTAGISPEIRAVRIEDIFSRRGSILRSFPGAAHDSWNNLKAEYILSLNPLGFKISATRRDTHNFFYADESSPSPGSLKTFRYKRHDVLAEVSFLSGPVSSGARFFYTSGADSFIAPRSRLSLFSEYNKGPYRLNAVVSRVSKGPWTDSFVNGLVKICYNLPSGMSLFLGADNILGEKVFLSPGNFTVSPYEWTDAAFFSAGVEMKWGQF